MWKVTPILGGLFLTALFAGIGLPGFSVYLFTLRGFYALKDTRTPFLVNLAENSTNIAFAYVDEKGLRRELTGTVSGRQMSGTFRDEKGQSGNWTATKK